MPLRIENINDDDGPPVIIEIYVFVFGGGLDFYNTCGGFSVSQHFFSFFSPLPFVAATASCCYGTTPPAHVESKKKLKNRKIYKGDIECTLFDVDNAIIYVL